VTDDAGDSYRMEHRAPTDDGYSAPLHDLVRMLPADVYEHPDWYGADLDDLTLSVVNAARGNPDLEVSIFRAMPAPFTAIRRGDWVALSLGYARRHAIVDNDPAHDYAVVTARVRACELFSEGNDLNEWGYDGPDLVGAFVPTV
jgi:hypothetical protein